MKVIFTNSVAEKIWIRQNFFLLYSRWSTTGLTPAGKGCDGTPGVSGRGGAGGRSRRRPQCPRRPSRAACPPPPAAAGPATPHAAAYLGNIIGKRPPYLQLDLWKRGYKEDDDRQICGPWTFGLIVSIMDPNPAKSASFGPDSDLYPFQINVKINYFFFLKISVYYSKYWDLWPL